MVLTFQLASESQDWLFLHSLMFAWCKIYSLLVRHSSELQAPTEAGRRWQSAPYWLGAAPLEVGSN